MRAATVVAILPGCAERRLTMALALQDSVLVPVRRVLDAVPPASGAAVMGTGIISIDLTVDGYETLSRVFLALTIVLWAGLGLIVAGRVLFDRGRARLEAASPASLTGVAGTAVLGARLALLGWSHVGAALLAIAFCVWLALVPRVLGRWTVPTVGVSFVLVVSTESLAVLAAILAAREDVLWLGVGALAALALGLAAYLFVLSRFDLHQLVTGRGDHWVAGGALAIATLACGRSAEAAQSIEALGSLEDGLGVAALALWAAAALWLPALVAGEVLAPRFAYDARRWSTVFPVGMYTASSYVVGQVEGIGGLVDFARVWIWVGFAVWLVVFAALLRRGLALWRGSV
ncbi:MAG TPA: tellurite resistance/C4-dicarboxylate transporter family protein [Gaiellaceae bacterium]|nr:tellurite resistance/C4-dicarboxylate transporter family protein [Gaiellaceae bacterium]